MAFVVDPLGLGSLEAGSTHWALVVFLKPEQFLWCVRGNSPAGRVTVIREYLCHEGLYLVYNGGSHDYQDSRFPSRNEM